MNSYYLSYLTIIQPSNDSIEFLRMVNPISIDLKFIYVLMNFLVQIDSNINVF